MVHQNYEVSLFELIAEGLGVQTISTLSLNDDRETRGRTARSRLLVADAGVRIRTFDEAGGTGVLGEVLRTSTRTRSQIQIGQRLQMA